MQYRKGLTLPIFLRYNKRAMKRPLETSRVRGCFRPKGKRSELELVRSARGARQFGGGTDHPHPAHEDVAVCIIATAAIFLVFGSALAPTLFSKASGDASSSTTPTSTDPTAERTQLEGQLAQLEMQINQYQGQISSYQTQGKL
jgi:hypothetical protein